MATAQITKRTSEAVSHTPLFHNATAFEAPLLNGDRCRTQSPTLTPSQTQTLTQELDQVRDLMMHCLDHAGEMPATQAGRYQISTGGGLLRARLALISGQHFGASADYRIASAAACELMHNASLVHDDLCDGDTHRRGQATVWKQFNEAVALCAGDLLMCAAFMAATEVANSDRSQQLSRCLASHTRTVIAGQSLEVAPAPSTPPNLRDYLQATCNKTAPFILLPLEAGALGGRASWHTLEGLKRAAYAIGLAYQIIDDLDDLAEGKTELHAYHAWHHHQSPSRDNGGFDRSAAVSRSARHALAALQRAHLQLSGLAPALHQALYPTLQSLHQRARHHREALPRVASNHL